MERKDCSGISGKISKTMKMKTRKPVLYAYNKKKYICNQAFLYINIYTYIYIYRERERDRQTDRQTETKRARERERPREEESTLAKIVIIYLVICFCIFCRHLIYKTVKGSALIETGVIRFPSPQSQIPAPKETSV